MDETSEKDLCRSIARRDFIMRAASGTVITAFGGGLYMLSDSLTRQAQAQTRDDGRPRLPPGQRVIESLKPMGGSPGDPSRASFTLEVHGEVDSPFELDFAGLLAMGGRTVRSDVHCVTGWSVLGAKWKGVTLRALAERAGLRDGARFVIFEGAHGYTANVRLREAMGDDVLIAWELEDRPLARPHGAPVRAVVPDFYFWKSAKWLTGIRFTRRDEPGYWETRGYHNHADPWKEERYG
ncbi:MAG: molybdopterin-dependent oxidoreductase [Myxococcales bacterium]|nr:molybdopterin-dependent oxidoreductase [Myxococcales bacterium]